MPNRFVGEWGSHFKQDGTSITRQEGTFEMADDDATHVMARFKPLGGSFGKAMRVTTTAPLDPTVAPFISFSRTDARGTTTYKGWLTRERPGSKIGRICGTFTFTPARKALLASEGDWTANRPPPGPGGGKRKNTKTGKKSAATKVVKSRKRSAKKGAGKKSVR
jgi:hypothetical protein